MKKNLVQGLPALCLAVILLLGGCGNGTAGGTAGGVTTNGGVTSDSGGTTNNGTTNNGTTNNGTTNDGTTNGGTTNGGTGESAGNTADSSDMFSNRDYEAGYDETAAAYITLNGSTAQCSSNAVEISGSSVTITDEGTYIISGTLTDGMIIVDAGNNDKLQLVLDGVSISSGTSAALYIRQADKVFVTTAPGSENTLSNAGEFIAIDDNNIDAAIFSKDDLTFNGQGSLTVESPAGHGIVSKDDLVFTGGSYTVSSASQALNGKESVRIAGGDFTITSGKDGIHSEDDDDASLGFVYILGGSYAITAEGDGISASNYLMIDGGSFDITAGGGSENGSKASSGNYGQFMGGRGGFAWQHTTESSDESTSMKGIKAGGNLVINAGAFTVNSADDGVHSNSSLTVSAGSFELATGDDGFHADETLTIRDGASITITTCYEGLEGLTVDISGGEISIVATDDGINAAGGTDSSGMGGRDTRYGGGRSFSSSSGSITISGGSIDIHASGDAVDSNGTLSITGGTITTSGPNSGDTSIVDYETVGTISGGTFIGTGAGSMAQNFSSDSTQGVIMASVGSQAAGATVTLKDSDGNVLLEKVTDQAFSCVILSCADILKGETYTLTVGSYEMSITMTSLVYSASGGMGGNQPGNMSGGTRGGR